MIIGIDGSRAFLSQKTGTEHYTYEMLRALAKIDKKNQYKIYIKKKQKIETQIFPSNFQFIEIPWIRFWTQCGLAFHSWKDKLDILWIPAHTLPILGKLNLPMIVTIHGIEYEHLPNAYKWGQNLHLTWSTRWAIKRAQKIIAVSQNTKQDLISKMKADGRKIQVINEGVDLEKFKTRNSKPENQKLKIFKKHKIKSPYILFVGTVQPRKNLIRLIEAFGKIINTQKQTIKNKTKNLSLVIVGKKGWNYEEILEAPRKYGVGDRVKFLGYISDEDLPFIYQNAKLYVEPSLQEGFGLPVLEAMASGVPVVAANAGALPEIVGNAGIIVDPLFVDSMAEGISLGLRKRPPRGWDNLSLDKKKKRITLGVDRLGVVLPFGLRNLSPSQLRAELISRGLKHVQKFSWQSSAKNLIKEFEKIVRQ